jgi:hypothetical protein
MIFTDKQIWLIRFWLLVVVGLMGWNSLLPARAQGPEPPGWYVGDMHVHRSCGGSPEPVSNIYNAMVAKDMAVVSLLADMGNGEVQNPATDLPKVNGGDDPISTPEHIVHWDAEWHWDATYNQYAHQALGGHIVALGLSEAHQIWEEYTYPILDWAHQQNGIAGFAHLQYLGSGFPQNLTCCTPIEYPVEVALGASDFISEDVTGSDSAIQTYYRLLNTGFRPGFAAGSDHPCGADVGSLLTYVQISGEPLTYRKWIEGIANGRTVVSRNGHNEFLDLKVNNTLTPGDELQLTGPGNVTVDVQWTSLENLSGTIELVHNGEVVASKQASVSPGTSETLSATVNFTKSGWLAARRMSGNGHELHTGAVFVTVDGAPVRASVEDAQFYVQWMDNLLENTAPGGVWGSYFVNNRAEAQARYQEAKNIYEQIALEAGSTPGVLSITTDVLPEGRVGEAYSATLAASGGDEPYTWSVVDGELPPGLTLDPAIGTISGTSSSAGTYSFTAQVSDAATPPETATKLLSVRIVAAGASTIWDETTTPALLADPDTSAVEVGVKFQADVDGLITGIRFYKSTTNTGTHVGNLWSSDGQLLATATFTNETASGWQQVDFDNPVAITANTVYVASYHTNVGQYSVDENYFAASGVDNGHLHALQDGESGGNGVYLYGSGGFPTNTYRASNYWVDVVFTANTGGTDTTLPTVTMTAPVDDATVMGAAVPVSADADDNVGVAGVQFMLDGVALGASDTSAPYSTTWDSTTVADGLHTLSAQASDAAGNTATATVSVSVSNGGGTDTTPPTVASTSPTAGANDVGIGTLVTVTFSEAMDAATISASTFELRDTGGTLVAAAVTYDAATNTATLAPDSTLANTTTYTATVKGGANGVKDAAGNPLADDKIWSFTTEAGDTTSPTVTGTSPNAGSNDVGIGTLVTATFSEAMDAATISASTFELREAGGALVAAAVTYDAATNTATLAPDSALTSSTAYTATVKSGDNGVKDAAGNPLEDDETWSFTTEAGDVTLPTVTGTSPTDGDSNVGVGTAVTATFSEAMDPDTITPSTFELRDAGALVSAAVTYDAATNTATLTPDSALTNSTAYTATVKSGDNGVKDAVGNPLADDKNWSFTTAAAGICPCSLWDENITPGLLADPDTSAVEVGVKFQADVGGYITGIRFYKSPTNTGTHVGNLWSSDGQLLATANFSNETASGWQQVDFDNPVMINANTIYVASYHTNVGQYSVDENYFTGSGVDNGPLHALQDGESGGNGVYLYGPGGFPTNTYRASNYWVDVVFTE